MENKPLALIIGGSRGIGRSIVLRLARKGYDICFSYLKNAEAADKVKAEVIACGVSCETLTFDVSDAVATERVLHPFLKERVPDVLVYNSGIIRDNLFVMMNHEEWHQVINTNLNGFYHVTKPVIFEMVRKRKGRVVVISSTSGEVGQAGQVNYSASKAGLIGAMKALAREVGKRNIFVNAVAPGVIETEMIAELPKEQVMPLIPLKRFGSVEDVSSVVEFLCTEENMYIHGQVIGINGGLAI